MNLVRDQEVGGSNPLAPTISHQQLSCCRTLSLRTVAALGTATGRDVAPLGWRDGRARRVAFSSQSLHAMCY